jgi:hypothetical protein
MINFLVAIALILFVAILFVVLWRSLVQPYFYTSPYADEEVVTTTTTTTTVETPQTVQPTVDQLPSLKREFNEAGQPFVKDPVDNAVWFLNTNDDMYEDANGKWWKLV